MAGPDAVDAISQEGPQQRELADKTVSQNWQKRGSGF
jgi:hypothetical protein